MDRPSIGTLRRVDGLKAADESELRALAGLMWEVSVPAGAVLVLEGTVGRLVFLIVAGRAAVKRGSTVVGHAGPGSLVGELAVLGGGRRCATVVAETQLLVECVDRRDIRAALDHPHLARLATRWDPATPKPGAPWS